MSQHVTDPLNRSRRDPIVLGCLVLAGLALVFAIPAVRDAREIAQYSAHSALWHEVNVQLKAREATGEFPARLEELPLTFPDGGSREMLEAIDYRREGAGCRVSTMLRGEKVEKRYGPGG
jgi:hypothetical protein